MIIPRPCTERERNCNLEIIWLLYSTTRLCQCRIRSYAQQTAKELVRLLTHLPAEFPVRAIHFALVIAPTTPRRRIIARPASDDNESKMDRPFPGFQAGA